MNARRKFVVIGIALVSAFRERAKKIPATAFMLWEIVGIPYDSRSILRFRAVADNALLEITLFS